MAYITHGTLSILRQILSLGHDIGLHFDAALYDQSLDVLAKAASLECATLEGMLSHPVSMISFHRPSKMLQDVNQPLAGRLNTYQHRFTREMGYCADSRGEWRFGHPLDHPSLKNKTALQLLTHPIWWTSAGSTEETLINYVNERMHDIEVALAQNCLPYQPILARKGKSLTQ